jgi:hypothetical protein
MISKIATFALMSGLAAAPGTPVPQTPPELPADTLAKLVPIRDGIAALEETAAAGIITRAQADQGTERFLEKASKLAGQPLTILQFESLAFPATIEPVQLTALQRFAGLITFFNVLWVLAIFIFVICLTIFLIYVLKEFPPEFYEVMLYLGSAALAIGGKWFSVDIAPYIGLTGCLMFAGALTLSATLHHWQPNPSGFALTCCIAWTVAAFAYGSQLIGALAVAAFMAALGFSVIAAGLCYFIGFEDEAALGRATVAAFALLALYTGLRVAGAVVPGVSIFETGALYFGSFVGYLGLLIASSRWYDGRNVNYALFQVITVVAGIGAIFFGSVFGIPELQKIGGTFFVLYCIEKLYEVPVESIPGKAFLGMVGAGATYAFCWYAKANPDMFRNYLFFIG